MKANKAVGIGTFNWPREHGRMPQMGKKDGIKNWAAGFGELELELGVWKIGSWLLNEIAKMRGR